MDSRQLVVCISVLGRTMEMERLPRGFSQKGTSFANFPILHWRNCCLTRGMLPGDMGKRSIWMYSQFPQTGEKRVKDADVAGMLQRDFTSFFLHVVIVTVQATGKLTLGAL